MLCFFSSWQTFIEFFAKKRTHDIFWKLFNSSICWCDATLLTEIELCICLAFMTKKNFLLGTACARKWTKLTTHEFSWRHTPITEHYLLGTACARRWTLLTTHEYSWRHTPITECSLAESYITKFNKSTRLWLSQDNYISVYIVTQKCYYRCWVLPLTGERCFSWASCLSKVVNTGSRIESKLHNNFFLFFLSLIHS